jgi:uncharacterized protein (TIGR00369 family)
MDRYREVVDEMENRVIFNRHLGLRIPRMEHGLVRMELPFREEFVGDEVTRALHGGLICTIADACGGAAAWSCVESGGRVSTLDLRIDYLHPAPPADLAAEARVAREGRDVVLADVRIFPLAEPSRTVATGRGVFKVTRRAGTREG